MKRKAPTNTTRLISNNKHHHIIHHHNNNNNNNNHHHHEPLSKRYKQDDHPLNNNHQHSTNNNNNNNNNNNQNNNRVVQDSSVHLNIRTDQHMIALNSSFSVTLSLKTRKYWDALVAVVCCASDSQDFSRLTYEHVKLPLNRELIPLQELESLIQHAEEHCYVHHGNSAAARMNNHVPRMFGSTGIIYLGQPKAERVLVDSSLIVLLAKFAVYHTRMTLSPSSKASHLAPCTACLEQLQVCQYFRTNERVIQQNLTALFYHLRGWFNYPNAEKAVLDYSKALEIRQDYAVALNNRAIGLESLEEFQRALADYTRAIELEPGYAKAYYNRSLLLEQLGEFVLSLRDAAMAFKLEPTDNDMQLHHAQLLQKVRSSNSCML